MQFIKKILRKRKIKKYSTILNHEIAKKNKFEYLIALPDKLKNKIEQLQNDDNYLVINDLYNEYQEIYQKQNKKIAEIKKNNRTITMFNCGFGDTFLISDGEEFLVDCGGIGIGKNQQRIITYVASFFSNNSDSNNLLITHFHRDHYNLIKYLPDYIKFNKIYLRNIYSNDNYIQLSFLNLILAASNDIKWSEALYSIFCLDRLYSRLANNGEFIFIKKGDVITVGNTSYDILSPDTTDSLANYNCFIDSFENNDKTKDAYSDFVKYYGKIEEGISANQASINKDFVENLNSLEVERKINSLREIFKQIKSKIPKNIKNKISQFEHFFNISFISDDKKLLMLGDENKYKIDQILTENNILGVKILKAPHHGTISHTFTSNLKSEVTLISYAKYSKYGPVACYFYNKLSRTLYCTNCNSTYNFNQIFNNGTKLVTNHISIRW